MTITEVSDKFAGFAHEGYAESKVRLEDEHGKLHTIKDLELTEINGVSVLKIIQGED